MPRGHHSEPRGQGTAHSPQPGSSISPALAAQAQTGRGPCCIPKWGHQGIPIYSKIHRVTVSACRRAGPEVSLQTQGQSQGWEQLCTVLKARPESRNWTGRGLPWWKETPGMETSSSLSAVPAHSCTSHPVVDPGSTESCTAPALEQQDGSTRRFSRSAKISAGDQLSCASQQESDLCFDPIQPKPTKVWPKESQQVNPSSDPD